MFDPFSATLSFMYGTSLAVLSFTQFISQRDFISDQNNKNNIVSIGVIQGGMSSVLIMTLLLAFPSLASLSVVSFVGWGLFFLPIVSALCAGGYSQVKESLLESNRQFLKELIITIDSSLSQITDPTFSLVVKSLSEWHSLFGWAFLAAQLAIFIVITPIQPIMGISGLGYSSLYYALDEKMLPLSLSEPMEKFNYWVNLCAGIFFSSTILKAIAIFNMAKEFFVNLYFKTLLKNYMHKDPELLQSKNITYSRKESPKIPRDISKRKFISLTEVMPDLSSNNLEHDYASLAAEIDDVISRDLTKEFIDVGMQIINPFVSKLTELKENEPITPKEGLFAWVLYYANSVLYYQKYSKAWVENTYFASVAMFVVMDSLLEKMESQGSGLSVNLDHMVDDLYIDYITKDDNFLSHQRKLNIYLKRLRQEKFDNIYRYFQNLPQEKMLFPFINFYDEYTYSFVMALFKFSNIKSDAVLQNDFSNEELNVAAQMQCNLYVHFVRRLMMVLDTAYSPKGILWHITNDNPYENPMSFNARDCCMQWAKGFSPSIYDYAINATEKELTQLYTLMLYDLDIIKADNPVLTERIAAVLSNKEQYADFGLIDIDSINYPLDLNVSTVPLFVTNYELTKSYKLNELDSNLEEFVDNSKMRNSYR